MVFDSKRSRRVFFFSVFVLCVFFVSRVARLGHRFHNTDSLHEGKGGMRGEFSPSPPAAIE